ncbi:MAG: protein translocase SEC61 complex subunit gamma [archaeon]
MEEVSKTKKFSRYLSSQFQQYKRVWRLLKRPTMQEFKMIAKVSALGLLIIGAAGFLVSLIMKVGLGPLFK